MGQISRVALAVVASLVAVTAAAPAAHADPDRPFAKRFGVNDTGDIAVVGNTLVSCPSGPGCDDIRAGTAAIKNNNDVATTYVDVLADGPATFNSSQAELSLPAGSTVLHAQLVWGADTTGSTDASRPGAAAPDPGAKGTVLLGVPGESLEPLSTSVVDTDASNGTANDRYSAVKDVTAIVRSAGNGTYTVGNVQAGLGGDRYAGWSLVVAYRDPAQPARNLSIYDGLVPISGSVSKSISVAGFLTPRTGPVQSKLGFVAYEGDLGLTGDRASLGSTPISDAVNPQTNVFNSTTSRGGVSTTARTPGYRNLLGFDADVIDITGALAPNATSATINLSSTSERYMPQVVTLATDLRAPRLRPTATVVDLNGGTVGPGDVLEYRYAGRNTGDDGAADVVLLDDLPAGLEYEAGSLVADGQPLSDEPDGDRGERAGGRVTLRIGDVPEGGTFTAAFRVRVPATVPRGTVVANDADLTFQAETLPMALTGRTETVSFTAAGGDLAATIERTAPFVRGARAGYRLRVANVATAATAGAVTLTAELPAGTTPESASGPGWSCAVTGRRVECTRGESLAAGAAFPEVAVPVEVARDAPDSLRAVARVGGGGDANPANDEGSDTSPVTSAVDLRVAWSAPASAVAGRDATWELRTTNAGPSDATGTQVTVSLPADLGTPEVRVVGGSACPVTGTTARCAVGALIAGTTREIDVTGRVAPGATAADLELRGEASAEQPELAPGDNLADSRVPTSRQADLSLTAAGPAGPLEIGQTVELRLTAANAGPSVAHAVTAAFALPDGLELVRDGTSPGCDLSGRTVTCALGTQPVAGSGAVVVVLRALRGSAGSELPIRAQVTGAEPDPDPRNDAAVPVLRVAPSADLGLAPAGEPRIDGSVLSYGLLVSNAGPSPATEVIIEDRLPAGATYLAATVAGGTCTIDGGAVRCVVSGLAVGEQREVRLTAEVPEALAGQEVRTSPSARAAESDAVRADNATSIVSPRVPAARPAPAAAPSPAAPATTPAPAAPTAPAAPAAPARCESQRRFLIRLRSRRGERIVDATVLIGKRRVQVIRGGRTRALIDLRGLPPTRITVRIRTRTRKGRIRTGVRRYYTCRERIPATAPPPL